jgi:hypothetical protein
MMGPEYFQSLNMTLLAEILTTPPTPKYAVNADLDGVNLLPLLTGQTKDRPHQTLYWRFQPQWAIRDGDYKLLQFGKTPVSSCSMPGSRSSGLSRCRRRRRISASVFSTASRKS